MSWICIFDIRNAPVSSAPPGLSTGGSNSPLFNFRGKLVWKPTSRLTVDLRPSRKFQQSGVNNTSVFTQTEVWLEVTQKMGSRTSLTGTYQFNLDEFDDPQMIDGQTDIRTDHFHRATIEVQYETLRWLGLIVRYAHARRTSTFSSLEFYANTNRCWASRRVLTKL